MAVPMAANDLPAIFPQRSITPEVLMFTLKYHVPITAAALLALAACGSGSDNGADPAATVKSLGNGNAAQTSLAKKADTPEASAAEGAAAPADAAAPAADGAAAPASAETLPADATVVNAVAAASPAAAAALENNPSAAAQAAEATATVAPQAEAEASAPPVNSAGVRGDMVLSMMDHHNCSRQYQTSSLNSAGADNDNYPDIEASNAFHTGKAGGYLPNYTQVPGMVNPYPDAVCNPRFYTYNGIAPGTYRLHDKHMRSARSIRGINPLAAHSFNPLEGEMDITVTQDGFSLGTSATGKAELGPNTSGKLPPGQDQELTLQSAAPFSTKFNARVPYGVLSVWKDAQGHNYQLMLLPGETGEARLCWNVNADIVKRLSCGTWSAPQSWKRGDALNEGVKYVIDDRTAYGEQGLIYFNDRKSE